MNNIFFDNWQSIWRILIIGSTSYIALILLLKFTGNRTLSKMRAFDFIVTIALGSTLSSVIIDKKVVLADGLTALALLAILQMAVAWISVRLKIFRDFINSEPVLLLHNGHYCRQSMADSRITEKEILQALRGAGLEKPEKAKSIVLEPNGTINIIKF